jgi:hypothetical protein
MVTTVAVRMYSEDLVKLDAIVEYDCSSRSAVLRKAIRLLFETPPPLPNASRNRLPFRVNADGSACPVKPEGAEPPVP